ncbi:subtilisin-like protease SBT4.6 [Humulus lupulus]|uniref:subtilisin-like protease SBT4.6 n=1 Tax=Humulus lupulus TaxID=3486 RepID=UPI002B4109DC|nr:subtilisin-like protease SBT4.6 [Humulus lupulus]
MSKQFQAWRKATMEMDDTVSLSKTQKFHNRGTIHSPSLSSTSADSTGRRPQKCFSSMGKYGTFQFYHFLSIFILTISFSCKANEDREVYIVYMGAIKDKFYSPTTHHLSILQSVVEGSSVANSLIRSYKRSFNGFAAKLTEKERLKLASSKEVVSIFSSKIYQTQTTRSWDFLGLRETVSRNPTIESDTIIGVIDTGIWPESESFSDEGFGPPPKKWKGGCAGGQNFTCNNKIIGARYYQSITSDVSARDTEGHGSHTASTAAGNNVKDSSFYGLAKGTARGGVPSSRISVYKVCNPLKCYSAAILAAFDDAIADGVDIITISINPYSLETFEDDSIAIGAFHAMEKGILTLNCAGNSGPSLGTMLSSAPWLMTVAASSIDRRIIDKVIVGNGTSNIFGNSINSFNLNNTMLPLVHGKNASSQCSVSMAGSCDEGCLDSGLVKGKVVLCDSLFGIKEAYKAGATGCIANNDRASGVSFVVPFPASALSQADYALVLSYLNSTKDPQATILRSEAIKDSLAPVVASFSSRGPNLITPDILKPDIIAPGLNILAAYSPINSPSISPADKRHVNYNFLSGTSMACPHVAGAAAYVKTFHPDWSPSVIKSSLMTTALLMNNTGNSNGEFAYGSGHVNPIQALNPGLVYDSSVGDYIKFLCSIGYDEEKVRLISGDNSSCLQDSGKASPKDLNYPSMISEVPTGKPFSIKFHRRVKNVGQANSTYKAKIVSRSLISIKVVPEALSFKSLNEEKSFNVIVNGGSLSNNSMVSASLVWSDGSHNVRSPIVLHNLKGPGV